MALSARHLILCLLLTLTAAIQVSAQEEERTEQPNTEVDAPVRRLGDVAPEEYELDLSVPRSPPPSVDTADPYELPDAGQTELLQQILARLAAQPGHPEAMADLNGLLTDLMEQSYRLMEAGQLADAQQVLNVIGNVSPDREGLAEAGDRLKAINEVSSAEQQAR